jgi:hypothetical protein
MPTRIDTTPTPSLFHMEWLVAIDPTEADDYTRAVAEKADALLDGAAFVGEQADVEARIWVEAACASACVSITYEPGDRAHGFHLLDDTLRERIACVVFDDLPCVGASDSNDQAAAILDAMTRTRAAKRE